MLCHSYNETTMAKGKNEKQLFQAKPWCSLPPWVAILTDWRQLIFNLKNHSFPNVLQQTDDLVVTEFGQVDPIHGFDVVTYIQLITPAK